nr:UDP-N-acetylenolpyruvoylglucosamine reductase [Klebsiella pneumoniae]
MGFCVSVVRPACRYVSRWRCAYRGYGPVAFCRPHRYTTSPPVTPRNIIAPVIRQAFPARYDKLTPILHQEATMNHPQTRNTFGIERFAKTIVRAETEQQLLSARQTAAAAGEPTLILGKAVMSCF